MTFEEMAMPDDKCPYCDANCTHNHVTSSSLEIKGFACGTVTREGGSDTRRNACYATENAELKAQLAQAKAVICKLPFRFEFKTFQQWVNKAPGWFPRYGVDGDHHVCLDAKGRICEIGKDMMQARDEDAFPIRVYSTRRIHQEAAKNKDAPDGKAKTTEAL